LRPHEGAGRFHYPDDIALARSGDIALPRSGDVALAVVCEPFEDRFQVYVPGERPPPSVVDASQADPTPHYGRRVDALGRLCAIAEPSRPSLLVFDLSSGAAIEITRLARHGRKQGQLLAPVDAEIHPRLPRVYVADAGTARISVFHLDLPDPEHLRQDPLMGRFVKSLDLAALSRDPMWDGPRPIEPGALEFDGAGWLWLVDTRSCRVLGLDEDLALARVFGRRGAGPAELARPVDLALSADGATIYVVDAGDRRVKAFDREGRLRFAFGGPADEGDDAGRFVRPAGIALCAGRVHVSDEGAHRLLAFDERGGYQGAIGRPGLGPLELHKPAGLACDGAGRLFVLDHGNHRCQVLAPDGAFVEAFGPRFFVEPANRPGPR
jgi:sugar lactone lactonase YvrE